MAIAARDRVRLESEARKIGAERTVVLDTSIEGATAAAIRDLARDWDGIDIIVTNTGGPPKGSVLELGSEKWKEGFQNLWLSVTEAIETAAPLMQKGAYGRFLLVTSVSAKQPISGLTVSNGLRAGLSGLVKSACRELGPMGITINALLPGYTRTERLVELGVDEAEISAGIPMGRLAEPDELGALAAFLASPRAGYITGQSIACDGGWILGV